MKCDKIKRVLADYRTIAFIWLVMCLVPWIRRYVLGTMDLDYTIFNHSFWHAWQQMPLYALYPEDENLFLYGPLFPVLMAPIAVLPFHLGRLIWMLLVTYVPFWSLRKSLFTRYEQLFILWFITLEAYTCINDSETNSMILACILSTFYFTEKEKDFWAGFLIALGTVTKIYGIVGLVFVLFSRHKLKFIGSVVLCSVVMLALPLLVFGPEYILGQYVEWYNVLVYKNDLNQFAPGQNISLLGIVRKVSGCATYSDLWLIVPGLLAFAAPFLRFAQYRFLAFRHTMLASVLMFVVLFSTGSESYGYIIAMTGVAIWYVCAPWQRSKTDIALMVFALILTSFSPSDLFYKPLYVGFIKPYALKALPVALIWFKLTYESLTKNYEDGNTTHSVL